MDTSKPLTPKDILEGDINELRTSHLLSLMQGLRKLYYSGVCSCCNEWLYGEPDPEVEQSMDRIRAVLATRPHHMNKKERKRARQAAAKKGR